MVDVDNFKQYNDAYGHLGGDECLQRIAGAVACEMRTNDLVARYGGEEFAVILPNQSLKGAAIVAERIRCRVEQLPAQSRQSAACGHGQHRRGHGICRTGQRSGSAGGDGRFRAVPRQAHGPQPHQPARTGGFNRPDDVVEAVDDGTDHASLILGRFRDRGQYLGTAGRAVVDVIHVECQTAVIRCAMQDILVNLRNEIVYSGCCRRL
jgi:hypothetical protein